MHCNKWACGHKALPAFMWSMERVLVNKLLLVHGHYREINLCDVAWPPINEMTQLNSSKCLNHVVSACGVVRRDGCDSNIGNMWRFLHLVSLRDQPKPPSPFCHMRTNQQDLAYARLKGCVFFKNAVNGSTKSTIQHHRLDLIEFYNHIGLLV